jgi:outer membrane protein assembly factor BamD
MVDRQIHVRVNLASGKILRFFCFWAFFASLWIGLSGCSAATIDNDSPVEAQYAEGERLLGKERTIEAVERFRILKSRFPYSRFAALATLRIGDAHFQEEAFLEAVSAYKIFRELYPRHERANYALFRIGEASFQQLPSTVDRDLEPAQGALAAFSELAKDKGEFQEQAAKRIKEIRERLASREAYVGEFYFIRENYQSAALRYAQLLEEYPESPLREEGLYRLAYSLERVGDFKRAERALSQLQTEFPSTKNEISSLGAKIARGLEGKP